MGKQPLIDELVAGGIVLTDGGWGTQLQLRGLRLGEMPDVWNLSEPDKVEEIARAYVEAGSRIVLTNTFRANRIAFSKHPMMERMAEINRTGVEISKRAAGEQALVFASIGPSGKQLLTGEVTADELSAAFAEQAQAQAEGGADGIVVETMTDLAEARLAIDAAKRTGLPVVACMVFDSGRDKDRSMMGVTPEQAAKDFTAWGADVIGANCGNGVNEYVSICERLVAATDLPVWIKPNAGIPELVDGEVVYKTTAAEFAAVLPRFAAVGAAFVGGCCGTDPTFIAAMKRQLGNGRAQSGKRVSFRKMS